jgi:hypothetical protein
MRHGAHVLYSTAGQGKKKSTSQKIRHTISLQVVFDGQ